MHEWTGIIIILAYGTASLLTVHGVLASRPGSLAFGGWIMATGWVLQVAHLVTALARNEGRVAVNLVASLELASMAMGLFCLVGWWLGRRDGRLVGMVLLPLMVISLVMARSVPGGEGALKSITDPWLISHLVLSLLAYGLFTVAAVLATLDALQARSLKSRQSPGWLSMVLPPLEQLEQGLFFIVHVAFALLTCSIATGMMFSLQNVGSAILFSHKTVFSWVTWGLFAVLLLGHHRWGWRGRRAVRITVWGYLFLLLSYLGVKVVYEFILRR